MLVDHHCHLDFPNLAGDLPGVLARARRAGVGTVVTIATHVRRFDVYRAIAEAHDDVWFSVGTHPHYADEEPDIETAEIVRLAGHEKCVAVGEAGLDYHYQRSSRRAQAEGFRRHIDAARRSGLPLEIHAREADADTLAILREEHAKGAFPAVLHCFTGGRELALGAIDLGLYVSFSGIATFKTGAALRDIACELPLEAILVETDAPYLAPLPFRGKANEPAYVAHTAAALAEARGLPLGDFARATTDNFFRLYSKARRPAAAPELPAQTVPDAPARGPQ
ncbi:MAG: TatD family hydrolase [Hyphomicrobiaceae bacterium]|nr:TatD family hydrolase [Hyphomicrobiaceae bacterium]